MKRIFLNFGLLLVLGVVNWSDPCAFALTDESSLEHFDHFQASIKQIEKKHSEESTQTARLIDLMVDRFNLTVSPCLEIIKLAFRHGLGKKWSSQSKLKFSAQNVINLFFLCISYLG